MKPTGLETSRAEDWTEGILRTPVLYNFFRVSRARNHGGFCSSDVSHVFIHRFLPSVDKSLRSPSNAGAEQRKDSQGPCPPGLLTVVSQGRLTLRKI